MRYAARTDSLHAEIRDGLRAAGVRVKDGSKIGDGWPDLVCWHWRTGYVMLDVKTIERASTGYVRTTDAQDDWRAEMPLFVVTSLIEALDLFGLGDWL